MVEITLEAVGQLMDEKLAMQDKRINENRVPRSRVDELEKDVRLLRSLILRLDEEIKELKKTQAQ